MQKSTRVTKLQVPGGQGATDGAQAAPAKTEAKVMQDRPSRRHYADMNAADIDPTTLPHAVLTKDGWLCPSPAEKK